MRARETVAFVVGLGAFLAAIVQGFNEQYVAAGVLLLVGWLCTRVLPD